MIPSGLRINIGNKKMLCMEIIHNKMFSFTYMTNDSTILMILIFNTV